MLHPAGTIGGVRTPRHARRARGAETIEFLFTAAITMAVTTLAIAVFMVFANTLLAQHALSQTALYVAANGRFTDAVAERCLQMMPDAAGASGARCRLLRADGSEIATPRRYADTAPVPFGEPMTLQVEFDQRWLVICPVSACSRMSTRVSAKVDLLSLTRQEAGR